MSERATVQTKTVVEPNSRLVSSGLLQRACACGGSPGVSGECTECRKKRLSGQSPHIQPKLAINRPGDRYEKEADLVADQVMRMAALTREELNCSNCGERQKVQRMATGSSPTTNTTPPIVNEAMASNGHPLDDAARSFFEPRFGHDFTHVRVHSDSQATQAARAVNARAFTFGSSIFFGAGEYQPQSAAGQRLLAHELTHVVQQNNTVSNTIQRTRIHFYDYTDNWARRSGYAAEYCEDYSPIRGQCDADITGNRHAGIDNINQVPGWISTFISQGETINEIIFHTHGAPGYVHLPNGGMNATNITILSGITNQLAPDATIDFKGCNVGEGATGQTFLLSIANTLLNISGGRARATDSVTFSVPGIGQRRPIWSSRPTACIRPGGIASMC